MENTRTKNYHHMPAKLIFNPSAGAARGKPIDILSIIHEMQAWKLVPEAYLIEPGCDLPGTIRDALKHGIRLFVVCGGDGTISTVASLLAGTRATLGIIPIGTQNNTALSLGIPNDISEAIAILRTGKRIKVDMGEASCRKIVTRFLEVCSVGLVSTLFPAADDINHGNLAKIGEFVTVLAATPPAEITLLLDNKKKITKLGHIVLVSNMPFIGAHFQLAGPSSYHDGYLDVLFFADLTKMDLLTYVIQGVGVKYPEDSRIQHFKVRRVEIKASPSMPVMTDGNALGEGPVRIKILRRALSVMVASPENESVGLRAKIQ
jgi:diacylglycerol kinase (ATP)